MIGDSKVITLCGSTKFEEEFKKVQRDLTIKGYIVLSCGLFGHGSDKEFFESLSPDQQSTLKKNLATLHKRRIDLSDEIFVINPGGYIGQSTMEEIAYAKLCDKDVTYYQKVYTLE